MRSVPSDHMDTRIRQQARAYSIISMSNCSKAGLLSEISVTGKRAKWPLAWVGR